jgi:hypothetical protein
MLRRERGATVAETVAALGWQAHSVRGAISGALKKKRGITISPMAAGASTASCNTKNERSVRSSRLSIELPSAAGHSNRPRSLALLQLEPTTSDVFYSRSQLPGLSYSARRSCGFPAADDEAVTSVDLVASAKQLGHGIGGWGTR